MAHSLENRVPFMDSDLVDFAMQCPVSLKLNNLAEVLRINENEPGNKQHRYFQKTNDGKQILRDMMSRHIPAEITQAEKQGFSAPDASWFKGESIEFVRRQLLNGNARTYEVLDQGAVASLVEEHLQGQQNRRLLIWSLLNVNQWCEEFLDRSMYYRLQLRIRHAFSLPSTLVPCANHPHRGGSPTQKMLT